MKEKITIAIAVPESAHLLDLTGPAHIFYEALTLGAAIELVFISILPHEDKATSSAGLHFHALQNFNDIQLQESDVLILPGLDFSSLCDNKFIKRAQPFLRWAKEQHNSKVLICSVCTGAFLLAESGLLNDQPCTTHWKYFAAFETKYPKTILQKNRLFVEAENIISTAGVSSGIDMSLYLVEKYFGSHFASKVARETVIYFRRGKDDPQLSVFLNYQNHLENRIHSVQEFLLHHFTEKNKIKDLAAMVNTSPRNLIRLFKESTGITIGQYIEKLRLEYATQLLLDKNKVEYAATKCGFSNANQLRHLFRKHKGVVPSTLR